MNSIYPDNPPEDLICKCGRHLPCRHCEPEEDGLSKIKQIIKLEKPFVESQRIFPLIIFVGPGETANKLKLELFDVKYIPEYNIITFYDDGYCERFDYDDKDYVAKIPKAKKYACDINDYRNQQILKILIKENQFLFLYFVRFLTGCGLAQAKKLSYILKEKI